MRLETHQQEGLNTQAVSHEQRSVDTHFVFVWPSREEMEERLAKCGQEIQEQRKGRLLRLLRAFLHEVFLTLAQSWRGKTPNDQAQARAEAGEARCSESPGA